MSAPTWVPPTSSPCRQTSSFSRAGLVDQLLFGGFTPQQAEFGVSKAGL
jgi:hypothetical protein